MKTPWLFGLLLTLTSPLLSVPMAHAAGLALNCQPADPPGIQGEELFLSITLSPPKKAIVTAANLTTEAESLTEHVAVSRIFYSNSEIEAGASWGEGAIDLSLMIRGGQTWYGVLRFNQDIQTAHFKFAAGTELDVICRD